MSSVLAKLRANEPLRLILWPIVLGGVGYLVTRGTIDTSAADLITAVALLILGGGGIEAARSRVWPPAHLPGVPASAAIDQIRNQIGEQLGQPGLDMLQQIEAAVQNMQRPGRHAE